MNEISLGLTSLVPKDPCLHIRSTWRDPIGVPLTNRRILNRTKEGWYGETAKLAALKKIKLSTPVKSGFVERCECGTQLGVSYLSFKYLPKPGFYCPACRLKHRALHDKDEEREKEFNKRVKNAKGVDLDEIA